MEKKLNIGDKVLIFTGRNKSKDGIKPFIKGKVIKKSKSDDLAYHGSPWIVDVYKVVGEDGNTYTGCYKDNTVGDSSFWTIEDYKDYLKRVVEHDDVRIREIEQSKRRTEIALSLFGTSYEEKKAEMEKCDHLFVKLKEGEDYYGFHSSDCGHDPRIVKCVRCGLTNKYNDMSYSKQRFLTMFPVHNSLINLNKEMFKQQFSHAYRRGGKSFDDSIFNMISEEIFDSNHLTLLYRIAKMIKPEGNNEEIFTIMKTLKSLETPEEKETLTTMEQVDSLVERYNNRKTRTLKHEKK